MKKTLPLLVAMLLVLSALYLPIAATAPAGAEQSISKDETVYVNLALDGSVQQINIVNRLDTPVAGAYTDYGNYSSVLNLSGSERASISGDKITWQLPASTTGFYYQGKLAQGELPYVAEIEYSMDGTVTDPQFMRGKGGHVAISFTIRPNPAADPYFRENYVTQVQVPLNLNQVTNVQAPGSSTLIVGSTATIAYTVLPNSETSYTLEFSTDKFQLDPITFASTPFAITRFMDLGGEEMEDGFSQMLDGSGEMLTGAKKLKQGLGDLDAGIGKLASGVGQLETGAQELSQGMGEYYAGLNQLQDQAPALEAGMSQLASEGAALNSGYAQLSQGIAQGMGQLTMELAPIMAYLPPEQQHTMASILAGLGTGMESQLTEFGAGLQEYTDGVSQLAQGIGGFSLGLDQLAGGGQDLLTGAQELSGGLSATVKGLKEVKSETKKLPGSVQELVDGQEALNEGLEQAADFLGGLNLGRDDSLPPKSFVSEKTTPRSVQFVASTPALKVKAEQIAPQPEVVGNKGFWTRLLQLFKKDE